MNQFLSSYGTLVVPAVVALVFLLLAIKIVNAVARVVFLVLVVAVLGGGFLAYGRVSAMRNAIDSAAGQSTTGLTTKTALYNAVGVPARQTLRDAGLNPGLLKIRILCAGPNTEVQLRYQDPNYLFGALDKYYDVPHDSKVHC